MWEGGRGGWSSVTLTLTITLFLTLTLSLTQGLVCAGTTETLVVSSRADTADGALKGGLPIVDGPCLPLGDGEDIGTDAAQDVQNFLATGWLEAAKACEHPFCIGSQL